MKLFLHRHCEENQPTEGRLIRRSNPLRVVKLHEIASSELLRFATQFLLAMTVFSNVFAQSPQTKNEVLNRIASIPLRNDFAMVAARIHQNMDTAKAYKQLDTLLTHAYGDMFWMYGCAGLYYATSDVLRPQYKARIQQCWKHCTPYRGDTENHFLMYYGSLFLMAQAWPDLPDTEWFMGKSSKEIYEESKEYLDHWIDETVRDGQEEWDSPRYGYYYITPLALLAEYTKDKRMKHRFEMMLEYELASYAADYLNGSYCGAHSRVSDECAIDPHAAEIETYGNYFFGEDGGQARLDTLAAMHPDIAFAAMTSFTCPEIIRNIANDRSEPYEQFSLKRGRQMLRNMDKWSSTDSSHDSTNHAPVYKYDYMTKDYCLGSMQGGIVQPIQQQSWSLVFNSDKHHNIITGLNPYVSEDELGMFFPEYPSFMLERIGSTKASYTNEDKWEGGSPYEHIYQDKNVLVALYDLPDSEKYREVDLFLPSQATFLWKEPVFLSDNPQGSNYFGDSIHHYELPSWSIFKYDSMLIAIQPLTRYETIETNGGIRWRLSDVGGIWGYIIYCFNDTDVDSLKSFLHYVTWGRSNGKFFVTKIGTPESNFDPSKGVPLLNFDNEWQDNSIFHSPYLESKKGSGILTMRYKGAKRALDFRN
jgi:hypothetical protein